MTIKDIAREAGVSFSTVSSVLRSPNFEGGKASAKTRAKIIEVARSMNYHPSYFGRGLRTGKSCLIAFLCSSMDAAVIMEAMMGVESVCNCYGYSMLVGTFDSPENLRKQFEYFIRKRVDGVLVPHRIEAEYKAVFDEFARKMPMVSLFGASDPGQHCVYVNPANIGVIAAEYLLELGHRKILVTGNRIESCETFCRSIIAAGIPPENLLHWPEYVSFEHGKEVVKRLISLGMPVTAVFANSDLHAAGILQQALLSGIAIPEDLSVLGVNNESMCSKLAPPLSTIAQPMREQGERAMETLLNLIDGTPAPESIVLQPYLKARSSCSAVRQ